MPILKRRNRIVVFRLSQDEYEGLKAACAERGAASISSFARAELLTSLDRNRTSDVSRALSNLETSVQRMTRILEAISGLKESK
jgi:hypothetical protein